MLAKLTLEVRGRVRTNRRRHRRESDAKISGSDAKANRMPVFEHFPVQVPIKRTLCVRVFKKLVSLALQNKYLHL